MTAHQSIATASLLAAFLAACSADVLVEETVKRQADQIEPVARASKLALSQAELNTYLSDRQYMHTLAPAGRAIRINHADPRQHRFALMRLTLAGQTPERAPALFADMEALRAADVARGLRPGSVAILAAAEGTSTSQHTLMTIGLS